MKLREFRTRYPYVAFALVLLAVVTVFTLQSCAINENRKTLAQVADAHTALCHFKADLQQRAKGTAEFIADVEAGRRPPITGITIADLQRSLVNQQATINSLDILTCP